MQVYSPSSKQFYSHQGKSQWDDKCMQNMFVLGESGASPEKQMLGDKIC